jgi:hypothetical protein
MCWHHLQPPDARSWPTGLLLRQLEPGPAGAGSAARAAPLLVDQAAGAHASR